MTFTAQQIRLPEDGKHTLGPWYVTECDDFIRVRQESSDAVLATMEDGTHPEIELIPWAEQQANAALIAAAPELLAALKQAAQWFDEYAIDHGRKASQASDSGEQAARLDKAGRNQERADFLHDAIAKALGHD